MKEDRTVCKKEKICGLKISEMIRFIDDEVSGDSAVRRYILFSDGMILIMHLFRSFISPMRLFIHPDQGEEGFLFQKRTGT